MACDGGSLPQFGGSARGFIQRQFANSTLGATYGCKKLTSRNATHPSIGAAAATEKSITTNPPTYSRRGECNDRHTVQIVRVRAKVVLQNR